MDQPDDQIPQIASDCDPTLQTQVQRLHQLTVYGRWLLVGLIWTTLVPLSLWRWGYEIALMRSYFTWSALRYGIIFNPLPAMSLGLCLSITIAVLVWQSRNILVGITPQEQKRLEQQVRRISRQGSSHPLWKWIFKVQ